MLPIYRRLVPPDARRRAKRGKPLTGQKRSDTPRQARSGRKGAELSARDFIETCQPDPASKAFILGGLSYRVSVHTQQLRSVKLVSSLLEEKIITSDMRAAVIGGGFAGVTCAASLAASGLKVTLYERDQALIPIQRKNRTRILHPSSIMWPTSPLSPSTDLPFLNWYTHYSQRVADSVRHNFLNSFKKALNDKLEIKRNANVVNIENTNEAQSKFRFEYLLNGSQFRDSADVLFLATGFEFENKISGFDRSSYWEDRNSLPLSYVGTCPRVAIVGNGDGALTDLFRCFWSSMDTEKALRACADHYLNGEDVEQKIREVEREARIKIPGGDVQFAQKYSDIYRNLLLDSGASDFLNSLPRAQCEVVVFGRDESPFSYSAAPINKALAGFLYQNLRFVYCKDTVTEVKFLGSKRRVEASAEGESSPVDAGNNSRAYGSNCFRLKAERMGLMFPKHFKTFNFPDTRKHFDRVIERIGVSRGYCSLAASLFDEEKLLAFEEINRSTQEMANPITGKFWNYTDSLGLHQQKLDSAAATIREYLEGILDYVTGDGGVRISVAEEGFSLDLDFKSESIDPDRVLPSKWFGMSVNYAASDDIFRDSNVVSGVGSVSASLSSGPLPQSIEANVSSELNIGSKLFIEDHKTGDRYETVLAGIFRHEHDGGLWGLIPKHATRSILDGRVLAKFTRSDMPDVKEATVGSLSQSKFDIARLRESKDDRFSILNDIQLFSIDPEVAVKTTVAGKSLEGLRSPYDHVCSGNKSLLINGSSIGKIKYIFNHLRLSSAESGSVLTEVFSIEAEGDIDRSIVHSGALAHTGHPYAVGFVVGIDERSSLIHCVEFEKVCNKLDLGFFPPEHA